MISLAKLKETDYSLMFIYKKLSDPNGHVLKDMKNPKPDFDQYPYYYSNPGPSIFKIVLA